MWHKHENGITTLYLYVQPSAKRSEIMGLHGDALKIRLASPPIDGRANRALLKYIAMLFDVPLHQVILKQGKNSRYKVVAVNGGKIDCLMSFVYNLKSTN